MAFRVLVVLAAFAVLCSCEQASSPVEKQEKEHGAEQVGGGEEKKGATGGTQNGESLKEAIRSDLEKVGEMQSESKSVDLEIHNRGPGQSKNMTFATVHLKMGEGELNVTGGADADRLMEADFSYNVSAWKPKVSKHVPGEWGLLTVRQGSVEGARGGDARNEWDIRLNDEVFTHLVVEVGAGESDLDLDSLNLGVPGHQEPVDLTVQMGAGDTTVDLTGDYTKNFTHIDASIQGGVGEATVLLPSRVGVKVKAQGLGKIDAKGLQRVDDAYVNDALGEPGVTLRVDIEGGFREINLEVV
jgi:hypothetical protein